MEQGHAERDSKHQDSPEPEGVDAAATPRGGGGPAEIYIETDEEIAEETADNEGFHAGRPSPEDAGDEDSGDKGAGDKE